MAARHWRVGLLLAALLVLLFFDGSRGTKQFSEFTGAGYVQLGPGEFGNTTVQPAWSFCMWIKGYVPAQSTIIMHPGVFTLRSDATLPTSVEYVYQGTALPLVPATLGQRGWKHLCVVHDTTASFMITLYRDNSVASQLSTGSALHTALQGTQFIGLTSSTLINAASHTASPNTTEPQPLLVDELAVFGGGLAAEEVSNVYAQGLSSGVHYTRNVVTTLPLWQWFRMGEAGDFNSTLASTANTGEGAWLGVDDDIAVQSVNDWCDKYYVFFDPPSTITTSWGSGLAWLTSGTPPGIFDHVFVDYVGGKLQVSSNVDVGGMTIVEGEVTIVSDVEMVVGDDEACLNSALDITSATTGHVTLAALWDVGVVPSPGDDVVIAHAVTVNSASLAGQTIRLEPGASITIGTSGSGYMYVGDGSLMSQYLGYQNGTFADHEDACPEGAYTQNPNLISYDVQRYMPCLSCISGQMATHGGQFACTSCLPGYYQNLPSSTHCNECAAGTQTSSYTSALCTDCNPGYFSPVNASTTCTACANGTFSGTSRSTTCQNCTTGRYAVFPATVCENCTAGWFQNETRATACLSCVAGRFTPSAGLSVCSDCASGRFNNATNSSFCGNCTFGQFANVSATTVCGSCVYAYRAGQSECAECPSIFQEPTLTHVPYSLLQYSRDRFLFEYRAMDWGALCVNITSVTHSVSLYTGSPGNWSLVPGSAAYSRSERLNFTLVIDFNVSATPICFDCEVLTEHCLELGGNGHVDQPWTGTHCVNVTVKMPEPIPVPSIVNMTSAGTGIRVQFAAPSDQGASANALFGRRLTPVELCTYYLEASTVTALSALEGGSSTALECAFTTPSEMTITELGNVFLIGSTLSLQSGKLVSPIDPSLILVDSLSSAIRYPAVFPTARVQIVGPERIGTCQSLLLSATGSSGTGGRPLVFNWTIEAVSGALTTDMTAHVNFTGTLLNQPSLEVPASAFPDDSVFRFTCRADNWMGTFDSQSVLVSKGSTPLPEAHIVDSNVPTARVNQPFRGEMEAVSPSCQDFGRLSFNWTQTAGPVLPSSALITNQRVLQVAPYHMVAGQVYSFTGQVTSQSSPSFYNQASMKVSVVASDLKPHVTLEEATVPVTLPLFISAEGSRDPDVRGDAESRDSLNYSWSCVRVLGDPCFADSVMAAAVGPFPYVLRIQPADLYETLHDMLIFTMTVTAPDGRSASKTSTVTVVTDLIPSISITTSAVDGRAVPGEKVSFTSIVLTNPLVLDEEVQVVYNWSITEGDLDMSEPGFTDNLLVDNINEDILVLKPGVLSMGFTYKITTLVQLYNTSAHRLMPGVATASAYVTVNRRPRNGECTVSPTSGDFLTDFHLACAGWTDDNEDFPLEYEISAVVRTDQEQQTVVSIGLFSLKNEYHTLLPMGNPSFNNNVAIRFKVRDQYGATYLASQMVEVTQVISNDLVGVLSTALDEASEIGDIASVSALVSTYVTLLNAAAIGSSPYATEAVHAGFVSMGVSPRDCRDMYRLPVALMSSTTHAELAAHPLDLARYELRQSTDYLVQYGRDAALLARQHPEAHHYQQVLWAEGQAVYTRRLSFEEHALLMEDHRGGVEAARGAGWVWRTATSISQSIADYHWRDERDPRTGSVTLGVSTADMTSMLAHSTLPTAVSPQLGSGGRASAGPRTVQVDTTHPMVEAAWHALGPQPWMRADSQVTLHVSTHQRFHHGHLGADSGVYTIAVERGTCRVFRVLSDSDVSSGVVITNLTAITVDTNDRQLRTTDLATNGVAMMSVLARNRNRIGASTLQLLAEFMQDRLGELAVSNSSVEITSDLGEVAVAALGYMANVQFADLFDADDAIAGNASLTVDQRAIRLCKAFGALLLPGEDQTVIEVDDLGIGVAIATANNTIGNVTVNQNVTFVLNQSVLVDPAITSQLADAADRVGFAVFVFSDNLYAYSNDTNSRNASSISGSSGLVLFRSSDLTSLVVENLTIPISVHFRHDPALTLDDRPVCRFWNDSSLSYEVDGCHLDRNASSLTETVCVCTHLTTFNVASWGTVTSISDFIPGFNFLDWEDLNISWADIEADPAPLLMCAVLFLAMACGLFITFKIEQLRFSPQRIFAIFKAREARQLRRETRQQNRVFRVYLNSHFSQAEDEDMSAEDEDVAAALDEMDGVDADSRKKRHGRMIRVRRRGGRIAVRGARVDDDDSDEDLTRCQRMYKITRDNLWYEHLWISVCTRRFDEVFTGPQRLLVVFAFMYTVLLASAFFFAQTSNPANDAVAGALIPWFGLPIVLLLSYFFEHSGPPEPETALFHQMEAQRKRDEWQDWLDQQERAAGDSKRVPTTILSRPKDALVLAPIVTPSTDVPRKPLGIFSPVGIAAPSDVELDLLLPGQSPPPAAPPSPPAKPSPAMGVRRLQSLGGSVSGKGGQDPTAGMSDRELRRYQQEQQRIQEFNAAWRRRVQQAAVPGELVRMEEEFRGKAELWQDVGEWKQTPGGQGIRFVAQESRWRMLPQEMRHLSDRCAKEQKAREAREVKGRCRACQRCCRVIGEKRFSPLCYVYCYIFAFFYLAVISYLIIAYGNRFRKDEFAAEGNFGLSASATWILWAGLGVAQDIIIFEPFSLFFNAFLRVVPCGDVLQEVYHWVCCCLGADFTS